MHKGFPKSLFASILALSCACAPTMMAGSPDPPVFDASGHKHWVRTKEGCLFWAAEKPWRADRLAPSEVGNRHYTVEFEDYPEGTSWNGNCEDGNATGYGVFSMVFESQHGPYIFGVYTGETEEGMPNGHGTYVYEYGEKYSGQWLKGIKNGFGVFEKWPYDCEEDSKSGKIKEVSSNGRRSDIYAGNWVNGEPVNGVCYFKSGFRSDPVICEWNGERQFSRGGVRAHHTWNSCSPEDQWIFEN